jgi:hypothetical protein
MIRRVGGSFRTEKKSGTVTKAGNITPPKMFISFRDNSSELLDVHLHDDLSKF